MWQPNGAQWRIIWTAAIVLILAWPPSDGSSLASKIARWVVDPAGTLPTLPAPLPMGLDDDGDAVAAHDALERDYYSARSGSPVTRWRMRVKEEAVTRSPIDPSTERQLLVGLGVVSALGVWRLNKQ
jgi:hypothetical protein